MLPKSAPYPQGKEPTEKVWVERGCVQKKPSTLTNPIFYSQFSHFVTALWQAAVGRFVELNCQIQSGKNQNIFCCREKPSVLFFVLPLNAKTSSSAASALICFATACSQFSIFFFFFCGIKGPLGAVATCSRHYLKRS